MANENLIIDPNKTRVSLPDAIIAMMNVVKEDTTATDAIVVLLDRRTGEFRLGSIPSDMNRTIEMLEKALVRIKLNAGK